MNIKTRDFEWYAKGVGMVKNETYDRHGKLLNYSVLISIIK